MATQAYHHTDSRPHAFVDARRLLGRIACIPVLLLVLTLMAIRPEAFRPDE